MILMNDINESSTTKNSGSHLYFLAVIYIYVCKFRYFYKNSATLGCSFQMGLIPTQVLTWSGSTVLIFIRWSQRGITRAPSSDATIL